MNNPYFDDDIQELLLLTDGIVLANDKTTDLAIGYLTLLCKSREVSTMTLIAMWDNCVIELMTDVPTAIRFHYNQATNTLFLALIERLYPLWLVDIAPLFASTRIALGVVNATR